MFDAPKPGKYIIQLIMGCFFKTFIKKTFL